MKIFGEQLSAKSNMIPAGGIVGIFVPILALVGVVAEFGDYGYPAIEKFVGGIGMFAAGVATSRLLPVWCEAGREFLEKEKNQPELGWLRLAKKIGWSNTATIFLAVCALVALIGSYSRL